MKSKSSFLAFVPILITRMYSQCTSFTYDKSKSYQSQGILADYNSQNVHQTDKYLNLHLTQSTGGTRISLRDTLQYGRVDARFRIASGTNVVSSFILMAENQDEIDFEFVQNTNNKTNTIQTNYFYRGIPIFNKNARFYRSKNPLTDAYHTYSINWSPDKYEWLFDDILLRTLKRNETTNYPDSPSKIQFGIWNANVSSWAGPGIDWSKEPFILSIESIKVSCPPSQTNQSIIPSQTLNPEQTKNPEQTLKPEQTLNSKETETVHVQPTLTTTSFTFTATGRPNNSATRNYTFGLGMLLLFFL